jgi:Peptidase family M28/PDZ domain
MKNLMVRFGLFCVVIFFSNCSFAQEISEKQIKKHIVYLSSNSLEGRGTGTKGEKKAAEYISKYFKKLRLQPKGNFSNSFYHKFGFKVNVNNPHDTVEATMVTRNGTNVVGFLDNHSPFTIVVGAHYDHLGRGYDHNSLDPDPIDKIHNGADDNASGVAGVLEIAKLLSSNKKTENYNFLFICFSGEELGLFGSKKYCESPTINLSTVNYMINMDMIGRLDDATKKLVIYGVGTAPDFVPLINNLQTDLSIKKDSSGIGPSDQTSFYLKDIPVLHFFTGQHSDYHKPSDDSDKINLKGEKKVLDLIMQILDSTDNKPKLTFLQTKNETDDTPKLKTTMGILPDYTYEGTGLHIDGVTEGKPAFNAGVKRGDTIVLMDQNKVTNINDYMRALSKYNKGDKATIKIIRDGKEMELVVNF